MAHTAYGKHYRNRIAAVAMAQSFPGKESAKKIAVAAVWPDGKHCPRCNSKGLMHAGKRRCPTDAVCVANGSA